MSTPSEIIINPDLFAQDLGGGQELLSIVESAHSVQLPSEISESLDPQDQVIREMTREVNRFSEMLNSKYIQTHVKAQMVSRKLQGLKILDDALESRRERATGSTLHLMAVLLQCVQNSLMDAGIKVDHQRVIINSLALRLEEAQHRDASLKLPR